MKFLSILALAASAVSAQRPFQAIMQGTGSSMKRCSARQKDDKQCPKGEKCGLFIHNGDDRDNCIKESECWTLGVWGPGNDRDHKQLPKIFVITCVNGEKRKAQEMWKKEVPKWYADGKKGLDSMNIAWNDYTKTHFKFSKVGFSIHDQNSKQWSPLQKWPQNKANGDKQVKGKGGKGRKGRGGKGRKGRGGKDRKGGKGRKGRDYKGRKGKGGKRSYKDRKGKGGKDRKGKGGKGRKGRDYKGRKGKGGKGGKGRGRRNDISSRMVIQEYKDGSSKITIMMKALSAGVSFAASLAAVAASLY